jgi:hypothetical protein
MERSKQAQTFFIFLRIKVRSRKDIERDNSILKMRCEYLASNNSNKLEKFLESLSDVIHEYD